MVIVAHRLATVRTADLIYVLHRGRVAEAGTHAELMARGGRYAAMWRAQLGPTPAPLARPPEVDEEPTEVTHDASVLQLREAS